MVEQQAGWYEDPRDPSRVRYWDGGGWTERTRPADDVPADVPADGAVGDPGSSPPPPPVASAGESSSRRRTVVLGVGGFVVVALVAFAVVFVVSGDDEAGAEVILEPAGSDGSDPFMDSVATASVEVPRDEVAAAVEEVDADAGDAVRGTAPGLYGGTGEDAVCDAGAMVAFLEGAPAKAEAFAAVQGIAPGEVAGFVEGLTPVVLRADTRVTNHGFSDGAATAFQSVLEAGTAVMVDDTGVPRVRCSCGNPLVAPADAGDASFVGEEWDGFDDAGLVTVSAGEQVEAFEVVDVDTGEPIELPVGTAAAGEVVLEGNGLGFADFGADGEETVAALVAGLGEPDDVREGANDCAGTLHEWHQWGRLTVVLEGGGPTTFVGYYFSDLAQATSTLAEPVATAEGITLGSTVGELRSAYGSDLTIDFSVLTDEPYFSVDGASEAAGLTGATTGGGDLGQVDVADADVVTIIEAGNLGFCD